MRWKGVEMEQFLSDKTLVGAIAGIIYFCDYHAYLFVFGAIACNVGIVLVQLVFRDGLYNDSLMKSFLTRVWPQIWFFITWTAMHSLSLVFHTVWSIVCMIWYRPLTILTFGIFILGIFKSPLGRSFDRQTIIQRLVMYTSRYTQVILLRSEKVFQSPARCFSYISQCMSYLGAVAEGYAQVLWPVRPTNQYYEHSPLQPGEIRLLHINRKLPCLSVTTNIQTTSLKAAPAYEAISYTWGTTSETRELIVNSKRCHVSAATYDAIYGCSSMWKSRLVWIDSVCINQIDPVEKADQVSKMMEVYQKAKNVTVFLGSFAFGTIMPVSLLMELSYHAMSSTDENWLYRRFELEAMLPRWKSLVRFLNHAWFTRVWIVQEVVVAKRTSILYGGLVFDWDTLMLIRNVLSPSRMAQLIQIPQNGRQAYRNLGHLRQIDNLRRERALFPIANDWGGRAMRGLLKSFGHAQTVSRMEKMNARVHKALSLEFLLTEYADFCATDPRDKIYALQGLTADTIPVDLLPNYQKSPEILFIDVAKYFWSKPEPFALIANAGIGHRRLQTLPSWAFDWTPSPDCAPLTMPGFWDEFSSEVAYAASGTTKPQVNLDHVSQGLVIVAGVLVDEVEFLSSVSSVPDDENYILDAYGGVFYPDDFLSSHRWHKEVLEMAMKNIPQNHRAARLDAFWRTLIGDRTPTERPAPPELRFIYHTWVQMLELLTVVFESGQMKTTGLSMSETYWNAREKADIWGPLLGCCSVERRFCVTQAGFIGFVPRATQVGDVLCIAYGARTPWVLRSVPNPGPQPDGILSQDRYQLVGECFVYGVMDGELMDELPTRQLVLV